jgi:Secretion system C-terminal sorting domain
MMINGFYSIFVMHNSTYFKMRKFLSLFAFLPLSGFAQLIGGSTYPINGVSNAPTSFSTIQDAATYLNTNGVTGTGNIILELQTGYNPAAEPTGGGIVVDSIPGTAANRRVIFRPATGFSATLSFDAPGAATLTLNRANYVTFDGRPGGIGSTKALSFTNISVAPVIFTGALLIRNSSKFNQFLYCNFSSNAVVATSATIGTAVVMFSDAGTFAAGNNGNKLYRCDINGNATVHQLLVSRGSTASPDVENRNDTIRGCNFYDNFSNTTQNIAINLWAGSDRWLIDSNNIYQTAARSYTLQAQHTGIATVLSFSGEAHIIAYNNIGGNAPGATGTMTIQGTSTNAVGYVAINFQHGENSFIFGNTIRNITLSYTAAAGSFSNSAIFVNMQYSSGLTNIGFNNISNLSFSNTNGFIRLRTVYLRSVVTATTGFFSTVQPGLFAYNNIISNITATASGGSSNNADLNGFTNESASVANLLGGTSIGEFYIYDNKITQLTAASTNTGTTVRAINSLTTQGSSSTAGLGNYNEIIKDTIAGLSTNSTAVGVAPGAATGIFINSGLVDTSLIEQCDISNIANTTTSDISNAVSGITVTNGSWNINRNRIYDLRNGSTGAAQRANIFGINIRSVNATSNVHNNQISIGNGQNNNNQVYGIINNFSAANQLNLLYNTVLISGTPTSGAANSASIYRGSDTTAPVISILTPVLIQNNLCINKRSGGTGNHTAVFNQSGAATGFANDFNTLVTANTSTAGQWGAAAGNFTSWKSSSAGDIYSYYAQNSASSSLSTNLAQVNLTNLFYNPTFETNGNLGIDSTKAECWLLAGKGKAVANISQQFNRGTNLAYPTCIGASEFNPQVAAPCSFESAAPSPAGTTTYSFAGRNIMSIAWGSTGTLPPSVCVKYYSGKAVTPASPSNNYSASYWEITAPSGSGYSWSPTINFSASERGTVPFSDPAIKQSFFNGASWQYLGPSATAVTATNPATSTIANINNQLGSNTALILTDVSNPIPVDLLYFTANRNGIVNNLAWATAQEINSSKFVIERSSNGGTYTAIGDVTAAGNSSTTRAYSFVDNAPARGINLYRLRIVDKDNQFRLSWTRTVRNEGLANVSVYPNPVQDKLTLNVQSDKALAGQVIVTDVNGKAVLNRAINVTQGENIIPVNAAILQKGTYFIKILLEGDMIVRKFNKL